MARAASSPPSATPMSCWAICRPLCSAGTCGSTSRPPARAIAEARQGDGPDGRGGGEGRHRHRQRDDARRAPRNHRSARARSARIRNRRLRRRRPPACERAGRAARLLSGARPAESGRALGARFSGGRVQERVRADLYPFDRRARCGRCLVALPAARRKGGRLARRAGGRARGSDDRAIRWTCATSSRASR